MAEEKSRKELLEEPDPFMVFVGKAMTFAKTYQQQIVMAVIAVALAALVISGVFYFRQKAEDRAASMFGKAVVKYQGAKQNKAGFAAFEEVKADLKALMDQYGNTGAGRSALITYADICYELKQYDEAVDAYLKAAAAFKGQNDFIGLIHSGLAYAHEARGDADEAEKYFNLVLSDPHAVAKDHALFNLARLYENQGKTEQRNASLKRLVDEYPESMFFKPAKEKMLAPVSVSSKAGGLEISIPNPLAPAAASPEAATAEPREEGLPPEAPPAEAGEADASPSPDAGTAEPASPPAEAEGAAAPAVESPSNP